MPTSVSPSARRGFDYASLDTETSQFVQQQTGEIRVLMKRTAQGIVEIGQKLIEVKEKLGHGRFGDWLLAEFDWSWDTAGNFMRVAQRFGDNPIFSEFAPSALYLLAAPSTPENARKEAIARAKAGEPITYTAAKAIKQKYATPPTKPKSQLETEPKQKLEPELVPELQPTPTLAPQSGSKLEIVAFRPQGQAPARTSEIFREEASRITPALQSAQALSAPQPSQPVYAPEQVGIWWQLGGRHLLYCGDPNSADFLRRIPEKVGLLLAFPLEPDWQPRVSAETCIVAARYLPQGKDVRLFEDTLESILLLYSDIGDIVVNCFVSSPEILSIVNRLDRRGIFAEPDLRRFNEVISDWKRAGLRAERLS